MNQRGETIGRLACIGVLIASLAGCSAKRDVSACDVAAEPELRGLPVVPPLRTSDSGLVPVVIALGRPIGAFAAVMRVSSPPRRLATESAVVRPISDATVGVRELLASYTEAFNRHDVAELAAHWASNGENLDLASGDVTKGRDAIRDVFKSLFETDDAATIDVGITSIRPVQSDVALVDGTSRVTFADGLEAGSRFAAVAVRRDGQWVLESVRESPLPANPPTRPLQQLAWLVGMWEDLGPGLTATTTCDWSPGSSFLVRLHTVRCDGAFAEPTGTTPGLLPAEPVMDREVTEIIAWDPERATIRSWIFASSGRFAEGTWSRRGDDWEVRIEGSGVDAGRTCGYVVGRQGSDQLTTRGGSGDGLSAALVPICDFVRTSR